MAECIACGANLSGVTHRCRYCEEPVCDDHRLPENHECVYQSLTGAPSTRAVTDTATESSTWAGVREAIAGKLPSRNRDDTGSNSDQEGRQNKTPLRKDTSDHNRTTWGSDSTPPNRSDAYPDNNASDAHQAEAATPRAPGASRDAPTSRSPDVETKSGESRNEHSIITHIRTGTKQLRTKFAYGFRRFRYHFFRTLGVGMVLTKYMIILGIIAFAVIGALAVYQPGLLAPLSDAGLPISESGNGPTSIDATGAGGDEAGAVATVTSTPTEQSNVVGDTKREQVENLIHAKINERREANGLEPIRKGETLRKVARSHSQEMAQQQYFGHESPSRGDFEDRYDEFGYYCRVPTDSGGELTGGENIWKMTASTESAAERIASKTVRDWMNSDGHRKNILTPHWDDMGIGVYILDAGGGIEIYATQNFC